MTKDGALIDSENLSDAFAEFFDNKVKSIVETCRVNDNVYNGSQKVNGLESNFMTARNVLDALRSIKIKNCEGYDRMSQRILNEGCDLLLQPITRLFELIYVIYKIELVSYHFGIKRYF